MHDFSAACVRDGRDPRNSLVPVHVASELPRRYTEGDSSGRSPRSRDRVKEDRLQQYRDPNSGHRDQGCCARQSTGLLGQRHRRRSVRHVVPP
jgi:hypothetical protein